MWLNRGKFTKLYDTCKIFMHKRVHSAAFYAVSVLREASFKEESGTGE